MMAPMGIKDAMATRAFVVQGLVTTDKMEKKERKEQMDKTDTMRLIST